MGRQRPWREKTSATILSPAALDAWKAEGERFVVGVMGFSGAWRRSGLSGQALSDYVTDAEVAMSNALRRLHEAHGDRLVMCSGATHIGVPGLAYTICQREGITAAGITAAAAMRYRLGEMAVLTVVGRRFGDESAVFVAHCDAFLLLGGGPQSAHETRAAATASKPITVIRGFGGAADAFTAEELPTARFVPGR